MTNQQYVISEPRKELVGEGKNAKYVNGESLVHEEQVGPVSCTSIISLTSNLRRTLHGTDCTELHLGNKGIQKIRGFEDFLNLEFLCINGNKLKKINNLDANFRLKVLCAQVGDGCTLALSPYVKTHHTRL